MKAYLLEHEKLNNHYYSNDSDSNDKEVIKSTTYPNDNEGENKNNNKNNEDNEDKEDNDKDDTHYVSKDSKFYIIKSILKTNEFYVIEVISVLIICCFSILAYLVSKRELLQSLPKEVNDFPLHVPPSDYHLFRKIILKNGLEVMLISDPLIKYSSAALSVSVGSMYDPPYLPGLAHFCEHMLFLGSKKYPNSLEYFKTVSENNGHFNAYTDRNITNFFFDVHDSAFIKTISIFSRFFIDPLLSPEFLEKEVNSVNSEFEKNLILDVRKKSQIFSTFTEESLNFNRFTTGNKETLYYFNTTNINYDELLGKNVFNSKEGKNDGKKVDLYKEMKAFHNKYYTADKMKLVIFSSNSIEELQSIVENKFNMIPSSSEYNDINNNNNNNDKDNNTITNNKYKDTTINTEYSKSFINNIIKPKYKSNLVLYSSVSSDSEITIKFPVPNCDYFDCFFHNPFEYYSYILENKESGSLFSNLKSLKLVNNINISKDGSLNWIVFSLKLGLTKEGNKRIDFILNSINNYFEYMRNNLISETLYSELKKTSAISFNILDYHKNSLNSLTSTISALMQKAHSEYALDLYHIKKDFNETVLKNYAEFFDLKESIIFVSEIKDANSKTQENGGDGSKNKKVNKSNLKENSKEDKNEEDNLSFIIEKEFIFEKQFDTREPWYSTNYTVYKIDFIKLKEKLDMKIKNNDILNSQINNNNTNNSKVVESDLSITNNNNKLKNKPLHIDKETKFYTSYKDLNYTEINTTTMNKLNNLLINVKDFNCKSQININDNQDNNTSLLSFLNQNDNFDKFSCVKNIIDPSKSIMTEPNLLINNRYYEMWHKKTETLDFLKSQISIFFLNRKEIQDNPTADILVKTDFIISILRKKLKIVNKELEFYQNQVRIGGDQNGIRLNIYMFTDLIDTYVKEIVSLITNTLSRKDIFNFDTIKEELKNNYMKDLKTQPYSTAYRNLKYSLIKGSYLPEDNLNALKKLTKKSLIEFCNKFLINISKMKVLFTGDINENKSKEVFNNAILVNFPYKDYDLNEEKEDISLSKYNKKDKDKKITKDNHENDKNKNKNKNLSKKIVSNKATKQHGNINNNNHNTVINKSFKLYSGLYFQAIQSPLSNPNNAVAKCLYCGEDTESNKFRLQLINSLIGNIVFQELRIKKQMGYIAKNKIDSSDNALFFCMHAQGSNSSPLLIDSALNEILLLIQDKIKSVDNYTFIKAKEMVYDAILERRFKLSSEADLLFSEIKKSTYNFPHYSEIKSFSANLSSNDLLEYWNSITDIESQKNNADKNKVSLDKSLNKKNLYNLDLTDKSSKGKKYNKHVSNNKMKTNNSQSLIVTVYVRIILITYNLLLNLLLIIFIKVYGNKHNKAFITDEKDKAIKNLNYKDLDLQKTEIKVHNVKGVPSIINMILNKAKSKSKNDKTKIGKTSQFKNDKKLLNKKIKKKKIITNIFKNQLIKK